MTAASGVATRRSGHCGHVRIAVREQIGDDRIDRGPITCPEPLASAPERGHPGRRFDRLGVGEPLPDPLRRELAVDAAKVGTALSRLLHPGHRMTRVAAGALDRDERIVHGRTTRLVPLTEMTTDAAGFGLRTGQHRAGGARVDTGTPSNIACLDVSGRVAGRGKTRGVSVALMTRCASHPRGWMWRLCADIQRKVRMCPEGHRKGFVPGRRNGHVTSDASVL